MAMKKYSKHFILIGIVSLALGVGFDLLIKTLVSEPEETSVNTTVETEAEFWEKAFGRKEQDNE